MLFYSHLCLKVGYADITYQKKKKSYADMDFATSYWY